MLQFLLFSLLIPSFSLLKETCFVLRMEHAFSLKYIRKTLCDNYDEAFN